MSRPLIPFGYFGGKSRHMKYLLPQLAAPHNFYCELFAGSAAVLLNKPRAKHEIINDLSGDVSNFWRVLREQPDTLCNAIDLTPAGEVAFRECVDAPPTDDLVERARRFFVTTSQNISCLPNGKEHSIRMSSTYKVKRRDLRRVADAIADVIVESDCACTLIRKAFVGMRNADYDNILFYADPPYLSDTRVSKDAYLVDYSGNKSMEFHAEFLTKVLENESNAKFAISGYSHPLYEDTLSHWHRVEWKHVCGNFKNPRTEVLWRNYEIQPPQEQLLL